MRSEVQIFPGPPIPAIAGYPSFIKLWRGAIAQLGERLLCKQEVVGSIPSGSTSGDPVDPGSFPDARPNKKNKSAQAIAYPPRGARLRVLSDIVKRRSFRANVERPQGRTTDAPLLHPYSLFASFIHRRRPANIKVSEA